VVVNWEHDALMEAARVKDDAPTRAENVFTIIKATYFWKNLAWSVS
jgi:hypothetical protein